MPTRDANLPPTDVGVVAADGAVNPEVAGRQDLLTAVAPVVLGSAPHPGAVEAAHQSRPERRVTEPVGRPPQGGLGIHLHCGEAVAGAVCEAEVAAAHVIAERPVAAHLVPVDPRVDRPPQGFRGVGCSRTAHSTYGRFRRCRSEPSGR